MKIPNVGISEIGVAIPKYFISVEELARARKLPPEFATKGLRVLEARIPYETSIEDLAAEALKKINYQDSERFYIGTESDPDVSKPFSIRIFSQKLGLTKIPFQYKFACLGGLEALISGCEYTVANQGKPAIVLAVDRSFYRRTEPAAEITQGCAAVAIKIEENPKLLVLDYQNLGQYAIDVDDFKVPISSFPFPEVNGELTKTAYLQCQKKALEDWKKNNSQFLRKIQERKQTLVDSFDFFVMHTPFPKIVEWVSALFWRHETQSKKEHITLGECIKNPNLFKEYKKELDKVRKVPEFQKFFLEKVKPSLKYNPYIGNSYTAAILISLIAILEKGKKGTEIGINGYGSGAGSICLRGILNMEKDFKSDLDIQLEQGKKLTIDQYENWRRKVIQTS